MPRNKMSKVDALYTIIIFSNADFLKVEALRNHPYSTFFI